VCGEHSIERPDSIFCCGSSPRVRGTSHQKFHQFHQNRFIPACAGNITPPVL